MDRLKVYNHEFDDSVELIHIVHDLCHELNTEISQATDAIPDELWLAKEKEHLHALPEALLNPYFEDQLTRVVSKEAMVQFRKCKYSVDPQYIGKTVEIELSETEENRSEERRVGTEWRWRRSAEGGQRKEGGEVERRGSRGAG